MLDWSTFNKPITLTEQLKFNRLFFKLKEHANASFFENDKIGKCYPGGNNSQLIIKLPNSKIGIKIYNNKRGNELVCKFQNEIRKYIYINNKHIQNVYKCSKIGNTRYAIQEWIEGDTLTEMYLSDKFNPLNVKTILDQMYLKLIIPLWKEGLIWKGISATNICYDSKKEMLICIDTDNMYKTAAEILKNQDFTLRNKIRINSFIKDRKSISNMLKKANMPHYNDAAFELIYPIYKDDINSDWESKALECYGNFQNVIES